MASRGEAHWEFPVVQGAGGVRRVQGAAFEPKPGETYKAVFDIRQGPEKPDFILHGLLAAARLVNLMGLNAPELRGLQLAAVFQEEAIEACLKEDVYRRQHGVDNPNANVLRQLRIAGARLYVCGQSLGQHGYNREMILPELDLAFSALTALIALEAQGFALISG